MLAPDQPLAWHTIAGGSRRYVDALLADLQRRRFTLELATPVRSIARANGSTVATERGPHRFDRVIVATHADTALALLADPTPPERAALAAFRYSHNRTVLHTDRAFLPRHPAAHAAWNYVADPDTARVAVTYSMTRLQGLPDRPYLVTLTPRRAPRGILHEVAFSMTRLQGLPDQPNHKTKKPHHKPHNKHLEVDFTHPQFDRSARVARDA